MKYGLFLGCNMPAIRPDVERAMRLTLPALGLELVDMEGCACCPAFGTFPSADEVASFAVNAWNLAIAEEKGVTPVTQCGSCYSSLRMGRARLLKDEDKRKRVNELLKGSGKKFSNGLHEFLLPVRERGTDRHRSTSGRKTVPARRSCLTIRCWLRDPPIREPI